MWVVGDDMLEKSANSLRKLMNQHTFDANAPELFIYKEYHVEAFCDNELKPTYKNIIRKVRNNLTLALNKYPTIVPNYLIILVGNSYAHDQVFVEIELKPILKRVLNDVGRLLASRVDQLSRKNQNLTLATEVFINRPLPKPASCIRGDHKFKNTRRYMNQMLDILARTFQFKPLNIDEINCAQRALFEKNGDLSDYGRERMWSSISEFIRIRDQERLRVLQKFNTPKQDVAVQVPGNLESSRQGISEREYHIPEKDSVSVDEYFTRQHSAAQPSASHSPRSGGPWRHQGYRKFDSYHRRYDRDDYRDDHRDDYYNY